MSSEKCFEDNLDKVAAVLCETIEDLNLLSSKLQSLGIKFDLYCPFPPYNHGYNIIYGFSDKIEKEKKGEVFCSLQHNFFQVSWSPFGSYLKA